MNKITPVDKTTITEIEPFTTMDGSIIRELMHPGIHGNQNQSLAEAIISVGHTTRLHKHHTSEELYFVTQGEGEMRLGNKRFFVKPGDTVFISPGTPHQIENNGEIDLKILCCCSPSYSDGDTEII